MPVRQLELLLNFFPVSAVQRQENVLRIKAGITEVRITIDSDTPGAAETLATILEKDLGEHTLRKLISRMR